METLHLKEKIFIQENEERTAKMPKKNVSRINDDSKQWDMEELFTNARAIILMKVHTSILSDRGIFINDTVVIDTAVDPVNDDIVVIEIDKEWLIRRYQKHHSRLVLFGDPGKISPLHLEPGFENFKIMGVVKYVVRSL